MSIPDPHPQIPPFLAEWAAPLSALLLWAGGVVMLAAVIWGGFRVWRARYETGSAIDAIVASSWRPWGLFGIGTMLVLARVWLR